MSAPAKSVERPYRAAPEVARLEQEWWDENAPLVAKVWELNSEVSHIARRRYLRRARHFFTAGRDNAHVVELGCGSGWVGQSICGPGLRITGTDFSGSQIALARENAACKRLDAFTRYQVAGSGVWPSLDRDGTGILIHAFLHHLDGAELDAFFDMLHRNVPPGTQVWIYEPAFYVNRPESSAEEQAAKPFAHRVATAIVARMSTIYHRLNVLDTHTRHRFTALFARAIDAGWYLSPKEVPFELDAFDRELARHVAVSRSYWATADLIGWVFETNLIRSSALRSFASQTLVRLLAVLDNQVVRNNKFMRGYCVAPNYGFRVWEGVLQDRR